MKKNNAVYTPHPSLIQQDPQHAAGQGAAARDVLPDVGGGALHGHVALAQDALLARVEAQLEHALDHDAVVDRHPAVQRGGGAGGKVHHAADGA
ncbi:hypothetical protein PoMZ_03260 [Pyricularia oryzae]|uniref:Uncharacterized protein n=1 Tax=Pyricularia oryzae TaxID=318829 RepID=A0A4P7N7A3_PYROR|nr:hypothetical protein PoMZ_03260 [Pyricularia oryzae]